MLLGLCDWGVGASRVTLAIALALLRCTAVVLFVLFPKSGQGGQSGSVGLLVPRQLVVLVVACCCCCCCWLLLVVVCCCLKNKALNLSLEKQSLEPWPSSPKAFEP